MKKYQFVVWLWLSSSMHSQNLVDLRTQSKNVDFSGSASTIPAKSGTALPATCNTGEMFFKTSNAPGQNLYACAPANTWTPLSGTGSGTVATGTSGQFGYYAAAGATISGHTLAASDIPALNYQLPLTFTGSGGKTASSTGTLLNNDCAKWDASGNVVDAGAPCVSVASGAAGQFAFYAANGSALTAHTLTAGDIPALAYQSPLSFTGSGTKTASSTGATVANDCAKWDASGNVVDAGAPCGSGSSSVSSFDNRTGAITLGANDVTSALSYTPLSPSNNLSELANPAAARANLGLNTAANYPTLNQNSSGNAATASAFDHVPTGCSASQFATGIAANGNLNCATPASGSGNVSTSANLTAGNVPKASGTTSLTDGGQAYPGSAFVGVSDVQTLTNKSISGTEINSGTVPVAQLPVATASTAGVVRPDGSTITISGGVLSAGSAGVIPSTNNVLCGNGAGSGAACNGAVVGNGATRTTTLRDEPFNVKNYGCVNDNSTDNAACIQAAIEAACATVDTTVDWQGAKVYLPQGNSTLDNNYYLVSKPILLDCGNLEFYGDGLGSVLRPSYKYGPTFVVKPNAAHFYGAFPTTTPLVGSTGYAYVSNTAITQYLDLSEMIGAGNLNGLGAFTVEMVVKPGTFSPGSFTYYNIFSSIGQKGGHSSNALLIGVGGSSGTAVLATANISGTTVNLTGTSGTVTSGGPTVAIALTFNGSTLTLWVNGAAQASASVAGTLQQSNYENVAIGEEIYGYPMGSELNGGLPMTLDNFRLSNIARYTGTYTPATSKFLTDGNTLGLLVFNTQYDSFTTWQHGNDTGWLKYNFLGLHAALNVYDNVHDMAITENTTNAGFLCVYSSNQHYWNISVYGGFRGMGLEDNCFESSLDHITTVNQTDWNMWFGNATGSVDVQAPNMTGALRNMIVSGGTSLSVYNAWFQTESGTQESLLVNSQPSGENFFNFYNCNWSTESGGSGLTDLMYLAGFTQVNFFGGNMENLSTTAPTIDIDAWSSTNKVMIQGVGFTNNATSSELINFITAPTVPVDWISNTVANTAEPISNSPRNVAMWAGLATYTVSTLPAACSAGQTAAVSDAVSPTYYGALTGGGSTYANVICKAANTWVSH